MASWWFTGVKITGYSKFIEMFECTKYQTIMRWSYILLVEMRWNDSNVKIVNIWQVSHWANWLCGPTEKLGGPPVENHRSTVYFQVNACNVFRSIYGTLKKGLQPNVVLSPNLLTCDFESGQIVSIRVEFTTVHTRGCYFHFCQAVYRYVQMLGLYQLYINDESSRLRIRKLLALAFLAIVQIPLSFENLKSQCSHELQPLCVSFWKSLDQYYRSCALK